MENYEKFKNLIYLHYHCNKFKLLVVTVCITLKSTLLPLILFGFPLIILSIDKYFSLI